MDKNIANISRLLVERANEIVLQEENGYVQKQDIFCDLGISVITIHLMRNYSLLNKDNKLQLVTLCNKLRYAKQ